MTQKTGRHQDAAERTIKDIRRQTRKRYSSEEKIRIVLAGLRGEDSIAELCRQWEPATFRFISPPIGRRATKEGSRARCRTLSR